MAVTYREIMEQRDLQTPRPNYYVGHRSFEVAKGDAIGLTDELWDETYASRSGATFPGARTAPIVVDPHILWHPQGLTGRALVRTRYESSGVGFCRVYTSQRGRPVEVLNATEGLVKGFELDGRHEWYLLTGDNRNTAPIMEVQLHTTYARASVPYATAEGLQGKINAADQAMGDFGTALAGKLRYDQMKTETFGAGYVRVIHYMTYDYDKWNNHVTSGVGYWALENAGRVVTAENNAALTSTTLTATQAIFKTDMVGRYVHYVVTGERFKIKSWTSTTVVEVDRNLDTADNAVFEVEIEPRRLVKVFKAGAQMKRGTRTIQAGLTASAPAFSTPNTTVTSKENAFSEASINHYIRFLETGNEYPIIGYTNTKVAIIRGDASGEGQYKGFVIGPLTVGSPRSSTAAGAPSKDNGTTTVTVDESIFLSTDVGRSVTFKTTGNAYVVATYTNPKVVVVTGNASAEADVDVVSIPNHRSIYETGDFSAFGFQSLTAW